MDEEKKDQDAINLKYLNHALRNGIVNMQGCLKEIEDNAKAMKIALNTFEKDLKGE